MDVGIIGVGVVGGATAEIFKNKHRVFLYDKYKNKYNSHESLEELAANSEVVFVCVPTPMKSSGEMDYSAIHDSINYLQREVESKKRNTRDVLITIRSTAVSGTTDSLAAQYPFRFAFNPEFLTEKNALDDMKKTDKIILGAQDEISRKQLESVYRPLFPNARYVVVDRKTAEMIKYAANVTLAGQIAIANEIYRICGRTGVDYNAVKDAILMDDRIGKNISVPGPDGDFGFGGKCFPKDLRALTYLAREYGLDANLLQEIWRSNLDVRKKRDWLDIAGATTKNLDFNKD